jgi:hypothetical protein
MTDIFDLDLDKPVRKIPIVKQLASKFGGKWTYVGMNSWECDDGNRTARRTSSFSPNDDDDGIRWSGTIYVYSNDKPPAPL